MHAALRRLDLALVGRRALRGKAHVEIRSDDAVGSGLGERVAAPAVGREELLRVLLVGGDRGRGGSGVALLRQRVERDREPEEDDQSDECL
jgi:hypothetical protein